MHTENSLIPVYIKFRGVEYTRFINTIDLEYANAEGRNNTTMPLYNEDGSRAKGNWQHGINGQKVHQEGLNIWWIDRSLIKECNYQNGRVKDSRKYLLSII